MPPGSTAGHDAVAERGMGDVVAEAERRRPDSPAPGPAARRDADAAAPAAALAHDEARPRIPAPRGAGRLSSSITAVGSPPGSGLAAPGRWRRRRCGAARG